MIAAAPLLSVVVPAHRAEAVLRRSLAALRASDLPQSQWELIVVDDASRDATPLVAAEYADRVVAIDDGPLGPAAARNCGAESARGRVLVFIDSDVCVHPGTLGAIAAAFRADPDLGALFGSYDAQPAAPGLVSQFRNLLHHHVHHLGAGPAETFWAGCGAVRRDAYVAVGMMDAALFPRPQIEDIELGRRLRRAGYRIELRPDIQGTHLKRWTLRSMVVTDFRDRGVPWMRLLLSEGEAGSLATLNLKFAEKLCTALVALSGVAVLLALVLRSLVPLLAAAAAVAIIVLLNRRFYGLLARTGGPLLAAAGVPLHLVFYFTGGLGAVVGTLAFYRDRRAAPGMSAEPAVRRAVSARTSPAIPDAVRRPRAETQP